MKTVFAKDFKREIPCYFILQDSYNFLFMPDHDLGGGVKNESVNIKMKSWHLHGTLRRSPTGGAVGMITGGAKKSVGGSLTSLTHCYKRLPDTD